METKGFLTIKIVGARDLQLAESKVEPELEHRKKGKKSTSKKGTMTAVKPSAFVHVSLGEQNQKTRVVKEDVNPNWNETITFELKEGEHTPNDILVLTVLDAVTETQDVLGAVTATVEDIISKGEIPVESRPLTSALGYTNGKLIFGVSWDDGKKKNLDIIDAGLNFVKGPRPSLLRAEYYYDTVKGVYSFFVHLPIVNKVSPTFEGIVDEALRRTLVKVDGDQRPVYKLDKDITNLLTSIDGGIDHKKDETLDFIHEGKDAIVAMYPKDEGIISGPFHFAQNLTGSAWNTGLGLFSYVLGRAKQTSETAISQTSETVGQLTTEAKHKLADAQNIAGDLTDKAVKTAQTKVHEAVDKAADLREKAQVLTQEALAQTSETVNKVKSNVLGPKDKYQPSPEVSVSQEKFE